MDKKLMNKIVKCAPKYMNDKEKLNAGQIRECLNAIECAIIVDFDNDEFATLQSELHYTRLWNSQGKCVPSKEKPTKLKPLKYNVKKSK